jgi:REP element-mobilizing transposase RayT
MKKGERREASHGKREDFGARDTVHVTMRVVPDLPSLRTWNRFEAIKAAFAAANGRYGMRILHYSVLSNHMHLIVHAPNAADLARAIKGMAVRIARAINRLLDRVGSLFAERYHASIFRAEPRFRQAIRNAVEYVSNNARRHGLLIVGPDPCSSAHPGNALAVPFSSDPPSTRPPG